MPTLERYNSNAALCITLNYFVVMDNRRLYLYTNLHESLTLNRFLFRSSGGLK